MLTTPLVGAWRSLVAHQSGGLGVAGSNPVAPTSLLRILEHSRPRFMAFHRWGGDWDILALEQKNVSHYAGMFDNANRWSEVAELRLNFSNVSAASLFDDGNQEAIVIVALVSAFGNWGQRWLLFD